MTGLYRGLSTVKIKRSALAPFSQACALVSVPCFVLATFASTAIAHWLVIAGFVPLALFSVASLVFVTCDRDRLHTEEHLERRQAMDIVESKGQGILLGAGDLVDIVNPDDNRRKLRAGTAEEGARDA